MNISVSFLLWWLLFPFNPCLKIPSYTIHLSLPELHKKLGEKEYVVEFDFLGKDSIHYHNVVEVEKKVCEEPRELNQI